MQQVQVQAARGEDAPDGHHHGVAEHCDTYKHSRVKFHDGRGTGLRAGTRGHVTMWTKQPGLPASNNNNNGGNYESST